MKRLLTFWANFQLNILTYLEKSVDIILSGTCFAWIDCVSIVYPTKNRYCYPGDTDSKLAPS
jgi:hypothetical protein